MSTHKVLSYVCVLLFSILALPASAQSPRSDVVDNVLEYIPWAGVFALKACGVESRDGWARMTGNAAASWAIAAGTSFVLKHTVNEWRPDGSDRRSFPSGHSAIAFAGATTLRREYWDTAPWAPIAGYSLATAVAVDRVLRDRHHWYDAAAGAAIGIAATELTFFVSDRLFPRKNVALAFNGTGVNLVIRLNP